MNFTKSVAVAIVIILVAALSMFKSNSSKPTALGQELIFSEVQMDEELLALKSDIIIWGRVLKLKEKLVKTSSGHAENKEVVIKMPVVYYDVQLLELIKGGCNLNKIKVSLIDSLNLNPFEVNGEYLMFLTKKPDGTYGPISYTQGVYKLIEGTGVAKSVLNNEKIIYLNKVKENL